MKLVAVVLGVLVASACYEMPRSEGDDDGIASGDAGPNAGIDADTHWVDGDAGADSDAQTDASSEDDAGVLLGGLGRTWTIPVDADVDRACEGTPCSGPELRFGPGNWGSSCDGTAPFELAQVIANCGDQATPAATTFAIYYGDEDIDPARSGILLAEGLIPLGLGARQAVEVHCELSHDEWSTAVAPQGYVFIDPADRVVECFEETNWDTAGGLTYECNGPNGS